MNPDSELGKLTAELVRELPVWCERGRPSTRHSSRASFAGDFRSKRVVTRGLERADPRVFTLDDEPSSIALSRLPQGASRFFMEEALTGGLRVIPAHQTIESEFVMVVDLSRSMLEGFVDPRFATLTHKDTAKLCALFCVVANFLYLAGRLGFRIRVMLSLDRRIHRERSGSARVLLQSTLRQMRASLLDSHHALSVAPNSKEDFNMVVALRALQGLPWRRIVAVVSDFLDPWPTFSAAFAAVLKRHHVILADVASQQSRDFPVPGFRNLGSMGQLVREGPWHLEEGFPPRTIRSRAATNWNADRVEDLAKMISVARGGGGSYLRIGADWEHPFEAFLRCQAQVGNELYRLR